MANNVINKITAKPQFKVLRFTNKATSADIQAILLAKLGGFSLQLIAERTGLSKSQVASRLHFAGVSLRDFRNGQTPEAGRLVDYVSESAEAHFVGLQNELKRLRDDFTMEVAKLEEHPQPQPQPEHA